MGFTLANSKRTQPGDIQIKFLIAILFLDMLWLMLAGEVTTTLASLQVAFQLVLLIQQWQQVYMRLLSPLVNSFPFFLDVRGCACELNLSSFSCDIRH